MKTKNRQCQCTKCGAPNTLRHPDGIDHCLACDTNADAEPGHPMTEQVITDQTFSDPKPMPEYFACKFEDTLPESHAGKLAVLLPRLRNDYFHGSHLLAPELLHLALEVREAADALTMPLTPEWKKKAGE